MKRLVYTGLGLNDDLLFKELLEREENETALNQLLDNPTTDTTLYSSALIFYSVVSEVTREVEVEEGIKK